MGAKGKAGERWRRQEVRRSYCGSGPRCQLTHCWQVWSLGPLAALNSGQAQRGIRGNLSACLDNPPSATPRKAPGPIHEPSCWTQNAEHMGASEKWRPSSSEGTIIAKQGSLRKLWRSMNIQKLHLLSKGACIFVIPVTLEMLSMPS